MSLRAFGAGLLSFSLACGGAAPPATPVVMPADSITATPSRNLRAPSAALTQRFAFDEPPHVRAYLDFETFVKSAVVRAIVDELQKAAGPALQPAQRACLAGFLDGARELAVGFHEAEHGDVLLLIRFEPAKLDALRCLQLAGPQRFEAVIDGDVLMLGEAQSVARARRHGGKDGLVGLELAEGRVGAFDVSLQHGVQAKGGLEMTASRFQLRAALQFADEERAAEAERMLGQRAKDLAELPPAAASLAKAIHVARSGQELDVDFTLEEPVVDQARDLGSAAALAVFAVRKVLVNAKLAEVRNVVAAIGRSLVSLHESETPTGGRRKFVACPPVPKDVPRGVSYQSSPADWKPWAPLRFELSEPQRFQYEVKVDKSGRHAEVLARGDLNGDGKTSLFRLAVDAPAPAAPKKGKGTASSSLPSSNEQAAEVVRVGTKIEETDPEE